MKNTHNTLRALAIGIGLALLVVTGTAAMMAVFSSPLRSTDTYRRMTLAPVTEPITHVATGKDSLLYQRVVLTDGRVQWVLTDERQTSLAAAPRGRAAQLVLADSDRASVASGLIRPVSYSLDVKPSGLSKPVKNCGRSAHNAYDIACNSLS